MFDQCMFIFNSNLGVNLRGQLLLKYKGKFNISLKSSDQFICELLNLDIIWLVNFMILTEIFILGFF